MEPADNSLEQNHEHVVSGASPAVRPAPPVIPVAQPTGSTTLMSDVRPASAYAPAPAPEATPPTQPISTPGQAPETKNTSPETLTSASDTIYSSQTNPVSSPFAAASVSEAADESLEQAPNTATQQAGESVDVVSDEASGGRSGGFSLFRFNRAAFMITVVTLLLVGSTTAGSLFFASKNKKPQETVSQSGSFEVKSLPIQNLKEDTGQLQVGVADKLAINGQLQINNGFVLAPSAAPSTPTLGQFYLSNTNRQVLYYNGTRFVGLATDDSLIALAGQQNAATQQLLAAVAGNRQITEVGRGLSLNGSALSSTGVLSVTGTAGQILVSSATGDVQISLPDLAFGGLLYGGGPGGALGSVATGTIGQCLLARGPGLAPEWGNCPGVQGNGTVYHGTATAGRIPKFTDGETIADSLLADNGTTVSVGGNLSVTGTSTLTVGTGATLLNGTLTVNGTTGLNSNVSITGNTSIAQQLTVTSLSTFNGGVVVGGNSNFSQSGTGTFSTGTGSVSLNGNTSVVGSSTFTVGTGTSTFGGAVNINGAVTVGAGNNFVQSGTGTFTTGSGAVALNGATTVASTLAVQGATVTVGAAAVQGSLVLNSGNGQTASIRAISSLAQGTVYTLPDPGAASATICLSTGNCAGAGGGITGSGTAGAIAKFNGAGSIANSGLTESDTTLTYAGNLTGLTGLTSAGTITFSGLNAVGVVHTNGLGVLSTGAVVLGTDTSGNYVANLGTLTGLSTSGNTGAGSTPTLSVLYGSTANTAAQGNTALSFTGTGNLVGGVSGTAGGGFTSNTLAITNSPVFSGTLVVQGASTTLGTATVQGSLLLNAGNSRIGTIQALASLGQNTTYTLPDPGAASATICLSSGNCTSAGVAGGDLTGSYPNPTIAKLQGNTVTIGAPSSGQIIQYNGTAFVNNTVSGDITLSGTGVATIGNGAVTNAKLQNSSLTVTAGNGLLGGGSVALGSTTTLSVAYGSTLNTAVQGNTQLTVSPGTGLSGGGTITLGSGGTTSLDVVYGSTAGTAVQGNVSLVCPAGTGNLSGGGNSVTLGAGGTCSSLTVVNSPTFSGTLAVQGASITVGTSSQAGTLILNNGAGVSNRAATLQALSTLGQNTTYTLPDPGAASATICLSTGNCAGAGGGITGSGTTGALAKFSSSGSIANSTLSESGTTVTASGSVVIQGASGLTLGVGSTADGNLTFRAAAGLNTVSLQAPSTNPASNLVLRLPNADGANGTCLKTDGAGNLSFVACTGGTGGGVTSVNGLTGVISINNASGSGSAITIDNASTTAKGIAQFNSTNFSVATGVVSTIQDIATSSSPTFSALTLQSNTNSFALTGTPAASATSSLIRIGSNIAGGNAAVDGGTYIGLNAPATGAGSAADFLNFQANGVSRLKVSNAGGLTAAAQLVVTSGGLNVTGNSTVTGTLSGLTSLTSSGTITFSGLNSTGVVHTNGSGVLSTGPVLLGSETSGGYVANLGTVTGLSVSGNSGAGSTPALSVLYGSTANTAVQGSTQLTCPSGTGNLSGGGTVITLGTGGTCGNLTVVSNPTFSGLVTANGGLTVGTGQSFTNSGSSLFTAISINDLPTGGPIGTAPATVDVGTSFSINQTTAGQTLSLPSPTNTTAARLILINNVGTVSFNMHGATIQAGTGAVLFWNGTAWTITNNAVAGTGLTQSGNVINSAAPTSVVNDTNIQGSIASNALTLNWAGQLGVSRGGTGANTFASNGLLFGNGTGALQVTAAAANSVLVTNGSNVPSLSQTLPLAVQGNITNTGILVSGSITTGFGTISTGNNITTTASLQGGTLDIGTGAFTVSNIGVVTGGSYNGQTISSAANFTGTVAVAGAATITGQLNANGGIVTNNTNINAGSGTITTTNDLNAGRIIATTSFVKSSAIGTGGVNANDVVVISNDAGAAKVTQTTVARDPRVYGVAANTYASGATGNVSVGGIVTVNADTAAVAIGDQLVTSTTAGRVTVDNNATTGIIGYATSTKAGGSNGTVNVRIQVITGQYSPVFRNATDSTTALQVQNAAGTSILGVDTTNGRLAVGSSAVPANGALTVGTNTTTAAGGVYFGTDTNLYRSAADTLKTDDGLIVGTLASTGTTALCITGSNQLSTCGSGGGGSNFILNGTSIQTSANFYIQAANSATNGTVGGIIRGAAGGQTVDLLQFMNTAGTVLSHFDASGNLAVGTASAPAYGVDVNGDVNVTGSFRINGVAICGGTSCAPASGSGNYIQNGITLQTNANFFIQSTGTTNVSGIIRQNASQTADLLQLQNSAGTILTAFQSDGKLVFGPSGAQDTNLYRSAVNKLKTDDTFEANNLVAFPAGVAGTTAIATWISGNTDNPFSITNDGILRFGSGAAAPDTNLYRSAVDTLKTDDSLVVSGASGITLQPSSGNGGVYSNTGVLVRIDSDSNSTGENFVIQKDSGAELFRVSETGALGVNVGAVPGAQLHVVTSSASTIGGILKASVTQTADLLQLQDTNGNINAKFGANGNALTLGRIAATGTVTAGTLTFADGTTSNFGVTLQATTLGNNQTITIPNATGTICLQSSVSCGFAASTGGSGYIQNGTGIQANANFAIQSAAAGSVGGVIRATASQTADLLQLQNSSGTVLTRVDSVGNIGIGTVTTASAGLLQLASGTTVANGIVFGPDAAGQVQLYRESADRLALAAGDELKVPGRILVNSFSGATVGTVIFNDPVQASGDVTANRAATATTGTTTGTGTNTTTLTLTTDAFAVNDVVLIDNVGQDYYTRITVDPGTGSYTVDPAVTFETTRTVTKYTIQNIGATSTDYTNNATKFFQGNFLGQVTVGAGTSTFSDGRITLQSDTNLYRYGAAGLRTDGEFRAGQAIRANVGLAATSLVDIGLNASGGAVAGILLGGDTSLYRGAANQLKTDDDLLVNVTSSTALIVQSAAGTSALTIDTSNGRVGVGSGGVQAGTKLYVASSTDTVIRANNTGGTNDILSLQRAGTDVLTVNSTGGTTLKNSSDSTTALRVQNAAGTTDVLTVNTTDNRLTLGAGTAFTLGSSATAPTSPTNGMMYYDTALGLIRVYQSGAWQNLTGGNAGSAPYASIYNTGTPSIINTAQYYLTFNSERADTDNMHSTSTNTDRITINSAGKYLVTGHVCLSGGTASNITTNIYKNGGFVAQHSNAGVSGVNNCDVITTVVDAVPGDYLQFSVVNNSGGTITLIAGSSGREDVQDFIVSKIDGGGGTGGSVPSARVYSSSNITVSNNFYDVLLLSSVRTNTDGMKGVSNDRLTVKTAGFYQINGSVQWAGAATGFRELAIQKNGSEYIAITSNNANGTSVVNQSVSTSIYLNVGDYISLLAYQNSGANLVINSVNGYSPELSMFKVDGGLGGTLQGSYDSGNLINTTDARDLKVTLADTATDANFIVNIATSSTGQFLIQANGTNTFSVNGNGHSIQKTTTNSTTGFQFQNASSQRILNVDTTNGEVELGQSSALDGKLVLNNATNANTVTIKPGVTTASYTLTLPTTLGASGQCLKLNDSTGTLGFGECGSGGSGGSAASYARAYRNTDQSIPTATFTTVGLNAETEDTDGYHDSATNNTRMTAPSSGFYNVTASVYWQGGAGTNRIISFLKNGTTNFGQVTQATSSTVMTTTGQIYLNTGDYVELQVYQNSGGNLSVLNSGSEYPSLSIFKVSGGSGGGSGGNGQLDQASVYHNTTQTAGGDVAYNSERIDNNNLHDNTTNNQRITFKKAGFYSVSGNIGLTTNIASGYLYHGVYKNNSEWIALNYIPVGGYEGSVASMAYFNAGDFITYRVGDGTGASHTINSGEAWTGLKAAQLPDWMGGTGVSGTSGTNGASYAKATYNTTQAIANGSWNALALNTEVQDTDGYHDNVTNNSRLTAPTSGFYVVTTNLVWQSSGTGTRYLSFRVNGNASNVAEEGRAALSASSLGQTLTSNIYLNAGDYVETFVWQDSGGALNVLSGTNGPFMSIVRQSGGSGGSSSSSSSSGSASTQLDQARAYSTSNQSINSATSTSVALGGESYDNNSLHDNSTNNTRITIKKSGVYLISGQVLWLNGSGNERIVTINKNGNASLVDKSQLGTSVVSSRMDVSTQVYLNAGDYIEMVVWQNTGGPISVEAASDRTALSVAQLPDFIGGTGVGSGTGAVTGGTNGASYVDATNTGTAQTIPNNTTTSINFNYERNDTDGYHDTAINTNRFVAPVSGFYSMTASVGITTSATMINCALWFNVNGTRALSYDDRPSQSTTACYTSADAMTYMNKGDYVAVLMYQNSGASATVRQEGGAADVQYTPNFRMFLVSGGSGGSSVSLGSSTPSDEVRTYNTAATPIGSGTWTSLPMAAEEYDSNNMHDLVTNNNRITFKTAGTYSVSGQVAYNFNATGYRYAQLVKNGTINLTYATVPASTRSGDLTTIPFSTTARFNAGDYIEIQTYQDSGGNLALWGGGPNFNYIVATKESGGTGSATTLQGAYDASANPAQIGLSTGKPIVFKANSGTTDTNLFQVQNASGGMVFSVDTTNSQAVLGDSGLTNGKLVFRNSTNSNTATIQTGVTTSSYTLTLPTTLGTSGQCLKLNDGTGTLTFADCGSGGSGGSAASYARVYNSSAQTVNDNTDTTINLNAEASDTDNYHDTVTNNTRMVAPSSGFYTITGTVQWPTNATGLRAIWLQLNGAGTRIAAADQAAVNGGATTQTVTTNIYLNAGDYVELGAYQTSGVGLALITNTHAPSLSIFKVTGGSGGSSFGGNGQLDHVRTYKSATQSIPNSGSFTAMTFDRENYDNNTLHDNSTNTTRLTAKKAGFYQISGAVQFENANATNNRLIRILLNGATDIAVGQIPSTTTADYPVVNATTVYYLNAGDYVELTAWQNSGVALNAMTSFTNFSMSQLPDWMGGTGVSSGSGTNGASYARVNYTGTTQAAATATWKTIAFDTEAQDTDGYHDNATNNTRLTAPTSGFYDIAGHISWQANATGTRRLIIQHNGVSTIAENNQTAIATAGVDTRQTVATKYFLNAGDYVEIMSWQDSGSTLNISNVSPGMAPAATISKVSGGSSSSSSSTASSSLTVPSAIAYSAAAQSIPNGSGTALTFPSEFSDNDNIHSTTSNTTRLTANTAGKYQVSANVYWVNSATGNRRIISIVKNGASGPVVVRDERGTQNGGNPTHSLSTLVDLNAGDYLEVYAYQDSGGSLSTYTDANSNTTFGMTKVDGGVLPASLGLSGTNGASYARIYNSTQPSIANSTWTTLNFDSESSDTDGYHSSTNPSRVTAPVSGFYSITGNVDWVVNSTGNRGIALMKNGTTTVAQQFTTSVAGSAQETAMTVASAVYLNAGDYIELQGWQNSGAGLGIYAGDPYQVLTIHLVTGGSGGSSASTSTTEPVSVRAWANGATNMGDNIYTTVNFNSEDYDTSSLHDNATNNSRITFTKAGTYLINGSLQIYKNPADTSGERKVRILLNGATTLDEWIYAPASSFYTIPSFSATHRFNAGDYIEVQAQETATGSGFSVQNSQSMTFLSATQITGGSGSATTLQATYDASGNPAKIQLAAGKPIVLQAANGTTDTNLFQIQKADGTAFFNADTTNGLTRLTRANDSALEIRSNSASAYTKLDIGRTSAEADLCLSSSANQCLTGTAGGDLAIRVLGATNKIHIGNANAATRGIVVDGNNNVGIGTSSPGAFLDIQSADNANAIVARRAGGGLVFNLFTDSSGNGNLLMYDSAAAAKLQLSASGNSYFNGGNVGIGTASPQSTLHVTGASPNYAANLRVGGDASTSFGVVTDYTQAGTTTGSIYASPGYSNAGVLLKLGAGSGNTNQLVLKGDGFVGIGTASPGTALDVVGTLRVKDSTANLQFSVSTSGIGVTTFVSNNGSGSGGQGSYVFNTRDGATTQTVLTAESTGDLRVGTGTTGCVKDADGTVIAGTCSSDERLKKNIVSMGSILDNFGQIDIVNYDWRSDEFPGYKFGTARQTGVIAQQVESLFPGLVSTDSNGFKTVDYTGLSILNIKATAELNSRTNALDGRVDALESAQQGGSNFASLNVSGVATINNLTVTGAATAQTLTVISSAEFKSDITVGGHIITAGDAPLTEVKLAAGVADTNKPTPQAAEVTVDGNDTAGTITLKTGDMSLAAGDLAKIIFKKQYGKAPRIILSAQDGKSAAAFIYPTAKTNTDFILKVDAALQPNATYTFDYFIAQ